MTTRGDLIYAQPTPVGTSLCSSCEVEHDDLELTCKLLNSRSHSKSSPQSVQLIFFWAEIPLDFRSPLVGDSPLAGGSPLVRGSPTCRNFSTNTYTPKTFWCLWCSGALSQVQNQSWVYSMLQHPRPLKWRPGSPDAPQEVEPAIWDSSTAPLRYRLLLPSPQMVINLFLFPPRAITPRQTLPHTKPDAQYTNRQKHRGWLGQETSHF